MVSLRRVLLGCALFFLHNQVFAQNNEDKKPLVEIGLASGKIIRAHIKSRDRQKIVYSLPEASEEQELALSDVIFIRSGDGKYEFIFPEENLTDSRTGPTEYETMLLAGIGLHYSDNSALASFATDFAKALAAEYNARLSQGGFIGDSALAAANIAALFSAEYRRSYGEYTIGICAGFTPIPKSSAVVSSANYSGQETINVDGYAIPLALLFYQRLWGGRDFSLQLGIGGGALFTSVLLTRNFGGKSDYQEAWGLAPMLILRPEFLLRLGAVALIAALPILWAEGRPISGDFPTTVRPASGSLTGVGFSLAIGFAL